ATSLRTRDGRFICAMAWLKATSKLLFRDWKRLRPFSSHETFSLRARGKLENRLRADAVEPDPVDADRARRDHWNRRGHVDGNSDHRDFDRLRQEHVRSGRRRPLRHAMAMEAGG